MTNKKQRFLTPMETNLHIETSDEGTEISEFRMIIGSLLFIGRATRPDICYPVNYLSCFAGKVTPEIMKYTRRIVQYLKSTKHFTLAYKSTANHIAAYVDAFFAPELQSCKSVSSNLIFHYRSLVSWDTRKQNIVTTSSTAVEYVAITDSLPEISGKSYI